MDGWTTKAFFLASCLFVITSELVESMSNPAITENPMLLNAVKMEVVERVDVMVDTSKIVNTVEKYFISYTLDTSVPSSTPRVGGFNLSSPKLQTLLSALSPAILRVGGSSADRLFFALTPEEKNQSLLIPTISQWLTPLGVIRMVNLTRATNSRLLLDQNLQLRNGQHWDPTNTISLMDFCAQQGFGENIDWELGNEPDWFLVNSSRISSGFTGLTPMQIADDISLLHSVVSRYKNLATSRIVGPDLGGGEGRIAIISAVANVTGSFLRAITFHHYDFGGINASYTQYLNPAYFNAYSQYVGLLQKTISRSSHPSLPLWLGEAGVSDDSGTFNVSDRFVNGFLWLDKLGVSARLGVNVVMRQVLYQSFYGLLDGRMNPNPDYWLSFVHKKFVGTQVLNVVASNPYPLLPTTRVYAHCTLPSDKYKIGAVTVFALNVSPNKTSSLVFFAAELQRRNLDLYLLQPGEGEGMGSVLSSQTRCNGVLLAMVDDETMPELVPMTQSAAQPVSLPPLSMAFIVFPDANVQSCVSSSGVILREKFVSILSRNNLFSILFFAVMPWLLF